MSATTKLPPVILGMVVGVAFAARHLLIGYAAAGLVALGIAAYYARKGSPRDSVLPLFWAAVGVPIGMFVLYVGLLGSWFVYCEHHIGSDNCA